MNKQHVALARLASFFLLCSQKKETKEKATPLPLVSFGLSAASGRLRNSCFQHSNSPRRLPSAAQAKGAAKGTESQNHANVAVAGFLVIFSYFYSVITTGATFKLRTTESSDFWFYLKMDSCLRRIDGKGVKYLFYKLNYSFNFVQPPSPCRATQSSKELSSRTVWVPLQALIGKACKGEFRRRLAWWVAQGSRKPCAQGVIFFDYFLLHKQKKVIRCRATPD